MKPIVIVSPHLDDAVLSIGATMSTWSRRGLEMQLVTLFAGDPGRTTPPSYWDSKRGSATASEATMARRIEDAAAARVVGATPVWGPFDDSAYVAQRDPDVMWNFLRPHVEAASIVLLPGWPLSHTDHRFATMLVLERLRGVAVGFYAETPYASSPISLLKSAVRGRTSSVMRHLLGEEITWGKVPSARRAYAVKREAERCYSGELEALGAHLTLSSIHEYVVHNESIGRPCSASLPEELSVDWKISRIATHGIKSWSVST
ncbi:MAG: PIG-L family deacetylase [Ilumatobacteraceae bacterium]